MGQLTVGDLIKILATEAKRNPSILKKKIVVADDAEGNAYHGMFYGLLTQDIEIENALECSNGICDSETDNINEIVILG